MLTPKLLQWPTPSSLKQSTQLHAHIIVTGSLLSPSAAAHLLRCVADPRTGNLPYALRLFDGIPQPPTFLWNTLIRACYRSRSPTESIRLYCRMRREGMPSDSYTFSFLLKSCALSSSSLDGEAVHGLFVKHSCESDAQVASSLVHMYVEFGLADAARRVFRMVDHKDVVLWTTMIGGLVKVGCLDEARTLFDEMDDRNVVTWTSMVAGYTQAGRAAEAVEFFKNMVAAGVVLDSVAMVSVVSACARLRDLELGKWVHQFVNRECVRVSDNLAVSLIDMYAKCGDMDSARRTFDSMGRNILPAWNAIVDGYCKMGDVDMARTLFDQIMARDLYSFNSMITGYIQSSRLKEALLLFAKLRSSGLQPDKFTMVGLLTACASLGALDQGKALHAHLEASFIEFDIFLGTALVDMYAKCGKMDQAMLIFDKMDRRDVLTWTTVISGLAMNGKGKLALEQFSQMRREGIRPNAVTYIGVLYACSHAGLVEEGRRYFEEMRSLYKLEPEIEHYGCMVDLLGRVGRLREALELIESMPIEPSAVIWSSLLSACRVHKDVNLAEKAARNLLALEPHGDAVYVQLGNIYADSGRCADASKIRSLMDERGVKKIAGYSSITVGGHVHKFIAGDQSHPQIMEIQEMMNEMSKKLKLAGYLPITSQVSIDVDEEEKEHALFVHSEKMAIAFGIMRLGANIPIHVLKNLRVCEDCHSAIKLISKIWRRDIVVRDRSRFHHFQDGHCSCNDFW